KIKSFSLIHDYFNANFSGNASGYNANVVNFTNDALNKRLKLTEVQEKDNLDNIVMNQTFEYFDSNLPPKNSTAKDHWGFFNGVTTNINTIPDITFSCPIYTSNVSVANYGITNSEFTRHNIGANREVNTLYNIAFSLKKITYPTKGSTEFEYETNTYNPTTSFVEDSNANKISIFQNNNVNGDKFNYCGGLRIKRIKNSDNKGNVYTKNFEYHYAEDKNNDGILENYSFGKLLSRPRYFGYSHYEHTNQLNQVVYSSSIILKEDPNYDNEFIGYDKVIVYEQDINNSNNGKRVFSYQNKPPYIPKYYLIPGFSYKDQGIPNDPNSFYTEYSAKRITYMFDWGFHCDDCQTGGSNSSSHTYYNRDYSFDYKPDGVKDRVYSGNGALLEEATYKFQSSNFTIQNLKSYQYNTPTDVKIWGIKLMRPAIKPSVGSQNWDLNYIGPGFLNYYMGGPPYALTYDNIVNITYQSMLSSYIPGPSQIKEINYFNSGNLETITNYFYDSIGKKLTSQSTTNSKGEILETKYYYPQDTSMSGEPNVAALVSKNMIGIPLKTVTNKIVSSVSEQLSEQTTKYGIFPSTIAGQNLILPQFIYAGKGTTIENKITFNDYDTEGNVTQYTPESSAPISIIWGYNKTQPIAKIENATNAQVASALGLSNLNNISETDLLTINNLRSNINLASAMITTYTYIPLVGVSTITDPKGNTINYNYDSFNRLQNVKDKDGNILSENEYHYKN
ncbi:MAG: hypothetical protein K2X95_04335, partial [Flavobacteriaceae bacterium]|nr:hypothetical protein [Flavobacteriaceae bacterium]